MNEKKAKLLRKKVYGVNNFRIRSYYAGRKKEIKNSLGAVIAIHITCVADQMRQIYQRMKRELSV
jgi:hypothetical protein